MANKNLLKIFFQIISLLGTPFFLLPAIIYFFSLNSALAMNIIYTLIATQIICTAIKYIYLKPRPVPMPNKTIIQKYIAGSFPSIHTARITAFFIPVIKFYPNITVIFLSILLVIAVGYSRIYLKKHYFTDVLAGFLIGAAISILGLGMQNYLN